MPDPTRGPAYRIVTPRLIVRCWDPKDAPLLKETIEQNLEHLRTWMAWAHDEPEPLQSKIERLRKFRGNFDLDQDFYYGIFDLEEKILLGATGLRNRLGQGVREIGYWIHQGHLNQGLATETTAALVSVAFLIDKVIRVEIHCDPKNIRSAAIPRKLGFRNEAVLKKRKPSRDGQLQDEMIWTLFEEDFANSPASKAVLDSYDVVGRRFDLDKGNNQY